MFNKIFNSVWTLLFVMCVLFANSMHSQIIDDQNKELKLQTLLGKEAVDVIYQPDSVTVIPVKFSAQSPAYELLSSGNTLSCGMQKELQDLLLDETHYVHELTKSAVFLPSLAFKFIKNNETKALILISLSSNQLKIINGENSLILDYDPAKEIFNSYFQKIKINYQFNQLGS